MMMMRQRECDENDSNVADGDVRATPLHTGRTGGNIGRTGDYDDDDRDDENSSYVDDGHDIGGVRYISCDVTREAIWCIFLTGPPTGRIVVIHNKSKTEINMLISRDRFYFTVST